MIFLKKQKKFVDVMIISLSKNDVDILISVRNKGLLCILVPKKDFSKHLRVDK